MPDAFEQHARALLEDSVTRIDGRIRSRLNQARHAAVEQAARRRSSFWKRFALMPAAGGAVAAAVVAVFVLWPHAHQRPDSLTAAENGGRSTVEDLDLLADGDALDLVSSDEADGGAFYEWAVEQQQPDSGETSS
jgi:ferric-dicitrate binding protein FerR (iron transport regulator)